MYINVHIYSFMSAYPISLVYKLMWVYCTCPRHQVHALFDKLHLAELDDLYLWTLVRTPGRDKCCVMHIPERMDPRVIYLSRDLSFSPHVVSCSTVRDGRARHVHDCSHQYDFIEHPSTSDKRKIRTCTHHWQYTYTVPALLRTCI